LLIVLFPDFPDASGKSGKRTMSNQVQGDERRASQD